MSDSPIAYRYAKALVELCGESKNHAVIGKQLDSFAQTWESSLELQTALRSPIVSADDKKAILLKIFSKYLFAPTTRNFLLVLLEGGRIQDVGSIAAAFAKRMDALGGRLRATVRSAIPMERSDLVRIQNALTRLTGHQIQLDATVDPSIIGGVVTEIGNIVLDGSLRTQLASAREALSA